MSDYMPKCATCEHFESCIMQKHITEMALILWNISREKDVPSIDIVRCKECKRWGTDDCFMCNECQRNPYPANPDDFCSYGERKESE